MVCNAYAAEKPLLLSSLYSPGHRVLMLLSTECFKLSVSSHAVPRAGQTPQPIITGIERKEEGEGDEITLQSTAEEELNISNCSI